MKNKNPDSIARDVSCYKPKKKDILKKLISAQEAKLMIEDLFENNYITYESSHNVRAYIYMLVEDLSKQLKDIK